MGCCGSKKTEETTKDTKGAGACKGTEVKAPEKK
jgi:hypothetical protein